MSWCKESLGLLEFPRRPRQSGHTDSPSSLRPENMALNVDSLYEPFFHPPLTDSDYRTASRGVSRKNSRRGSASPMASSVALPNGDDSGDKKEEISALDPRRFTPTLHANLVSEILSLRRDLESKNGLVLKMEEDLAAIKEENTTLQESLARNVRDNKSTKRQMDALEGGTLTAIEDLAKERDQATGNLAEVKQRLDVSQKKVRGLQADSERSQAIYERDREKWDVERRLLERKVHVVEGRLRTVIAEVESVNVPNHHRAPSLETSGRPYSRERPGSRTSGTRSAASRHRDSATHDAERFNLGFSSGSAVAHGAKTLADELDFEEGSDAGSEGGYISPEALPEERSRPFSVQSHRQSIKARKLLGLAVNEEGDDEKESTKNVTQEFSARAADALDRLDLQLPVYVDSSTQYSPPTAPPESDPQRLSTIDEIDNDQVLDEASQEYDHLHQANLESEASAALDPVEPVGMVSCACQTIEPPLSPPATPTRDRKPLPTENPRAEMATASTQTLEDDLYAVKSATARDTSAAVSNIPLIAIHPAADSARSSVVLPPHTSNAACQASISPPVRSVSVQTEGIRIDERLERLPDHLHPSIIRPYSPSPSPSPAPEAQKPKHSSQSLALRSSLQVPARPRPSSLRRSVTEDQAETLRTTQDGHPSSEDEDGHVSDDSFLVKAPIKKTLSKVQNAWQLVSQLDGDDKGNKDTEDRPPRLPSLDFGQRRLDGESRERKSPRKKFEERSGRPLEPLHIERPNDLKRSALISSGSAAHIQRTRSPSEPARSNHSSGQDPPFPVPDRHSSRKLPWSPSDGSGSPISRDSKASSKRQGRPPTKRPMMRKSRSAVDSGHRGGGRSRSRSPPPFESFADGLSSIPPPLPANEITSPYASSFKNRKAGHEHHRSVTSAAGTTSSDSTGVVDAIAQTMIGEWMWKYVRRRKSFGLPDTGNEYDSSQGRDGMMTGGIRHQRWVWVAPYEMAVMWSSKQPTSGSALMGKSGRKRTCQLTWLLLN